MIKMSFQRQLWPECTVINCIMSGKCVCVLIGDINLNNVSSLGPQTGCFRVTNNSGKHLALTL